MHATSSLDSSCKVELGNLLVDVHGGNHKVWYVEVDSVDVDEDYDCKVVGYAEALEELKHEISDWYAVS